MQVVDLGLGATVSIELVLGGGDRPVRREGVSPELLHEVLIALREYC